MLVKIQKIYRSDTDKNGNKLVFKTGKRAGQPYTRVAIQIGGELYSGKWISGFESSITKDWKEGSNVNIDIEQKGEYFNFTVDDPNSITNRLRKLEGKVEALEKLVNPETPEEQPQTAPEVDESIDPDSIPF